MTSGPGHAPRQRGSWRDVDGILLLDKPVGLTSNAALQRVRRLYQARKAGHTGSLDPLASGLLPICFGQATKVSGLLLDADKTYEVTAALGASTATGDAEGEVTGRAEVPPLDGVSLGQALAGFRGEITQVPPMYSALKHQGERLYRLARRGIEVERAPRPVRIHRLDLLRAGESEIEFVVTCSKGTYVRTLVEDIARALGTVGHVSRLRRTGLGPFSGLPAHALDALEAAASKSDGTLEGLLLPVDAGLSGWPAVSIGPAEQACVLQGQAVFAAGPAGEQVRIYGPGGLFLGTGRMAPEGRRLAPERIMLRLEAAGGEAP